MSIPKVPAFIPSFNCARYLPAVIESILNQDFRDFELIISDDASSDNSVEICKAYAECDSRIRLYSHTQNKGMVENCNWCIEQARGEYIKPMLADDLFSQPYSLKNIYPGLG